MKESTNKSPNKFAAIFTGFKYPEIPFERLNQLEKVGITNIYIILGQPEYKQAQEKRFQIFDDSEKKTILEHYKSHTSKSRLQFHVLNAGEASSEKEKLHFYLNTVKEHYFTNLFFYEKDIPELTQNLRGDASSQREIVTTYILPFFTSTNRALPQLQEFNFSALVKQLMSREVNPCFCYKLGNFDIVNVRWLLNVFTELTVYRIKTDDTGLNNGILQRLTELIIEYDANITELEKAEKDFTNTHKKMYKSLEGSPSSFTKWRHEMNVEKKEYYTEKFYEIIDEAKNIYEEITEDLVFNNRIQLQR